MDTTGNGCTCGPFWSTEPPPPCWIHRAEQYTPVATAWLCPRCQKMNAPHSAQCSCTPAVPTVTPETFTVPFTPLVPTDPIWNPWYDITCCASPMTGVATTITIAPTLEALLGVTSE